MNRVFKWVLGVLLLVVLLLGGVALVLQHWVNTDDFRVRVSQQASAALGVPVELGAIHVNVWPLPAVAVDNVRIKSQPALTLERIEARPTWAALLRGELEIATLYVRNAVVPQQAVAAIGAAFGKAHPPSKAAKPEPRAKSMGLPRQIVLDQVTWVHAKGGSSTVDARARLDERGLPNSAKIQFTQGRFEGAQATVERDHDVWTVQAKVGGGTVNGKVQIKPGAKGGSQLTGQFDTANVEVAALTAPSKTLTGKLEAHTTMRAEVRDIGALGDALQTHTKFTVRGAVVHGIDLAQAVKTVGMNRGGQTTLDTLAGNVVTQGKAVQLNNLVATSGSLSANGNVAMSPDRNLSGRVTVDLASTAAGGTFGVPLVVGGTLDSPSVTLSRGALLGAAIGTAIAPGVGTAGGAKAGDLLGESLKGLFGK